MSADCFRTFVFVLSLIQSALGQAEDTTYLQKKASLLKEREQLNNTVWAQESAAQHHESTLVHLWDRLLDVGRKGVGNPVDILADVGFESIRLGTPNPPEALDHGIERISLNPGTSLTSAQWAAWLQGKKAEGYALVQSEWHHAAFTGESSEVSVVLHVIHPQSQTRFAITGVLNVQWSGREAGGRPIPQTVDASGLRLLRRTGKPAFEKWKVLAPSVPGKPAGIHPLLAYDLNGDGLSEIVAAGCNQVLTLDKNATWISQPFLQDWERFHETGLLADVTGDGHVDFLAPNLKGDMVLFPGSPSGLYLSKGIGRSKQGGPLTQPTAFTAGDVDGDGDLDLWIGQYRISYVLGIMPSPYYDALDGFPSFLLLNDGKGRFAPAESDGLEKKNRRRTYTGSLVDLDNDRDLDLITVNDFAGVDMYRNDGKGHFTDVTDTALDERHLFGMSATYGDYNLDGKLDFFVAGMGSTTARRLEQMGAARTDDPNVDKMRMKMAYGNRLYLNQGDGTFREPAFKDRVARTGWTWGTTTLDFDNDGDQDIFVANGHSSGESTKDHCTQFWCHDIYKPLSQPDRAMHEVFQEIHRGYFNKTESWDGYQKNQLLMNLNGKDFENIAFLMGVADEFDGRATLADDFDGDGRVDLLVVQDLWQNGQILHVYRNVMETSANHWVGVRLREQAGKPSPIGATVAITVGGRDHVGVIATGETIHAQHAPVFQIGLGKQTSIDAITVTWPDGKQTRLVSPTADQIHRVDYLPN